MSSVKSDADLNLAEEEGLLSRWSRRKHEARSYPLDEVPVKETLNVEAELDEPEEAVEPEAYQPDDSDMPALESLDEDSDYSGFMSPKVSDALRTLALRQLFRGSTFNIRDGLDDYDDDFTQFTKLGDVVTAEMRRQMARLKEASEEDSSEEIVADQGEPEQDDEEAISTELSEVAAAELNDESDGALDEKLELTGKEVSGEKLYDNEHR